MAATVDLGAPNDVICHQIANVSDTSVICETIKEEKSGQARGGILIFLDARLDELITCMINGPLPQISQRIACVDDSETMKLILQAEMRDRNRATVVDFLNHQFRQCEHR